MHSVLCFLARHQVVKNMGYSLNDRLLMAPISMEMFVLSLVFVKYNRVGLEFDLQETAMPGDNHVSERGCNEVSVIFFFLRIQGHICDLLALDRPVTLGLQEIC